MPSTFPDHSEIQEILLQRVDQQKQAVGIVAGIIEPAGRRVLGYGHVADGDPRTPDGDTIFEIGSVTKVFTSLLLADMVNRKEVALDDPASKYLPENVKMPERNGKFITLLDLATHYSGLPPLPGNLKPVAEYGMDDLYQFLSSYILPRGPGSEYEYSNLGAGLLGQLLACLAGMDYANLIRTRITQPLNMPDTGIAPSCSMSQRLATGHTATLTPVASSDFPRPLEAAGALRSTANDLLTFLEALLGYRQSPLAPAMNAMLEVRRPAGRIEIGLGWLIYSTDGLEIAGHEGATGGFCSCVSYDPKTRRGVVVLSNAACPIGDIALHLLNPKVPLANPKPPGQRSRILLDPQILTRYTGRYQVAPNLSFEITCDGNRLFAQGFVQLPHNQPGDLTGLPQFELFAEREDKFFAVVADQQVTFETGPAGRATNLILHKGGRDMPAPRLP